MKTSQKMVGGDLFCPNCGKAILETKLKGLSLICPYCKTIL